MAELKLRSKYPDSLRQIIESALSERLHSIEAGIKRTKERLQEFETNISIIDGGHNMVVPLPSDKKSR
jgi:hypothetical protein